IKQLDDGSNARRKEYVITEQGKAIFRQELERLEELLLHAKLVQGSEEK
ncbi:MAG: PadR family transcriptional regulator, partial [Firmicutes bacterium]|nr:PadR family transcriptional regulator [Bacillota bacterium]